MMDPTKGQNDARFRADGMPVGKPFQNGNPGGARKPSLKALTRQFLRNYLTEKLGEELLDAQAIKALEGDTAAFKAIMDYCGHRPIEEHADVSAFDLLMQKLNIKVQRSDAPRLPKP